MSSLGSAVLSSSDDDLGPKHPQQYRHDIDDAMDIVNEFRAAEDQEGTPSEEFLQLASGQSIGLGPTHCPR